MNAETGAFFDAMRGALRGALAPADVEARCGPASSTDRLALVLRMVRAGRWRLLESIYVATRRACAIEAADRWEAAGRRLLANENGLEPDYPAIALGLPEALEAVGADGWVVEVADFEESIHRLRVVGAPPAAGRLRGPVIVRSYTADVPGWWRAAREASVDAAPRREPTLVMIYRGPALRPRWHRPSAPQLGALALAMGEAREDDLLAGGVTRADLDEAWRELRRLGLVTGTR